MSGDHKQEYFTSGLPDDIATALSRFQDLSVIARDSTITYANTRLVIQNIGQNLGIEFAVTGHDAVLLAD